MLFKSEYVVPVVVGACAAVTGAAIGYKIGSGARFHVGYFNKSYRTGNPLVQYASDHSVSLTPVQEKLKELTLKHKSYIMMGSPDELNLLASICRAIGAKKTIDVGVFTGVSALSIALTLPEDGRVVACDVSTEYTDIGKPFWKEAGVDKKIDLRIAPAKQTLRELLDDGEAGTYDFAFIDADKTGYDTYYELCLKLLRPGGLIALDNMIMNGTVIDATKNTPDVKAIRSMNDKIYADKRVDSTLLLIGDGTVLAFKR